MGIDGSAITLSSNNYHLFFSSNVKVLTELRSGQNDTDLPLDKTLTPGGVAEEFTKQAASPWDVDRLPSFGPPVGADDTQDSVLGQNPFDTEGLSRFFFTINVTIPQDKNICRM